MKNYIYILISFFLISCNFNSVHQNRIEDKKDAEKVVQKFYTLLKENNKDKAFKLFSEKFFQATSKEQLNQMIDWTNKEGGLFSDYTLSSWQTLVIEGAHPKSDYSLVYYVKRNSINTQEIFSLQKEDNTIKIVGYKINLDVK